MATQLKQFLAGTALIATVSTQVAVAPDAYSAERYYSRTHTSHPVVRGSVIGGALGAGLGAIGGAIAGRHRAGRGALWGLGSGAGIGAVESAHELRGHPVVRNTATGALAGLGIGGVMKRPGKGAGIGALLGGGLGVLRSLNGSD